MRRSVFPENGDDDDDTAIYVTGIHFPIYEKKHYRSWVSYANLFCNKYFYVTILLL
jgi:hypothetical protein